MNSLALFIFLAASIDGLWLGTLDFGGQKLRIVLHLKWTSPGTVEGVLESPDPCCSGTPYAEHAGKSRITFHASPAGA
ncbi:MAG TPA: hypothetical protein VES20_18145 [Bryobacteraceae bacterium]|nr:hypothetical protein [Bryobacteraceae bacterium]